MKPIPFRFNLLTPIIIGLALLSVIPPETFGGDSTAISESSQSLPQTFSTSDLPLGAFISLPSEIGTWTAPDSTAAVLIPPNQARRSMHFWGQEEQDQHLVLTLPAGREVGGVSFEIERWTSRPPFSLKLEARYTQNNAWKPVLALDAGTPVGFGHRYFARINGTIDALRFSAQTFPDLGIMIHEISFVPIGPMKVTKCECDNQSAIAQEPLVLNGRTDSNPQKTNPSTAIQTLRIHTQGMENPLSIEQLQVSISEASSLYQLAVLLNGKQVKKFHNLVSGDNTLDMTDCTAEARLSGFEDVVTIEAVPSANASLDKPVVIAVPSVKISGQAYALSLQGIEYPFAVMVRDRGWDGVNGYRIPGIVKTPSTATHPQGVVVAVYDIRRRHCGDLPADIDIGVSRSFDDGQTWQPMQVAMDMENSPLNKDSSVDPVNEGVGDPTILYDSTTGRLWIAALWAHNAKSTMASEPGLKMGTSGQLVLCSSDDQGQTWSAPVNITRMAAPDKNWCILFQGPGDGIVTRNGTLVFPAQFIDQGDGNRVNRWAATIVYSKDHGKTWTAGSAARFGTCEAQVVELADGQIMINMRNFHGRYRTVATTKDLGQTWQEHPTSGNALVEPICQASLIRVADKRDGDARNVLAFFNPDSESGRINMTVKLSQDEGMTWPVKRLINVRSCFGYSAMTMLDKQTIGLFYETAGGLLFQKLRWEPVLNP